MTCPPVAMTPLHRGPLGRVQWRGLSFVFVWFLPLFVLAGLPGCAGVEVVPVDDGNRDHQKGIRFYRSKPYLLVERASVNDAPRCRIVYLPDRSEEYAARTYAYFATETTPMRFDSAGNLIEVGRFDDSDDAEDQSTSTEITALNVEEPEELSAALDGQSLRPGLYELTYDGSGASITGVRRVDFEDRESEASESSSDVEISGEDAPRIVEEPEVLQDPIEGTQPESPTEDVPPDDAPEESDPAPLPTVREPSEIRLDGQMNVVATSLIVRIEGALLGYSVDSPRTLGSLEVTRDGVVLEDGWQAEVRFVEDRVLIGVQVRRARHGTYQITGSLLPAEGDALRDFQFEFEVERQRLPAY